MTEDYSSCIGVSDKNKAISKTGLQTVDYQYNIRGWMTHINDPANLGTDLFGYKINYNYREGLEIPNSDFPDLMVKPKFNGNIAEVLWKTQTEDNEPLKRYGYVYDGLNRLSAGFYQKAGYESSKEYFEKMTYDLEGNISRLQRSAGLSAGLTTALAIDNLKYDYEGNKLTKVTEEQIGNSNGYPYLASPNTITYDENGNMTSHKDKAIASIQYNFLNLPNQVNGTSGKFTKTTNYTYRADGVKVGKSYSQNSAATTTLYLDGFQYKFSANTISGSELQFVPTSEGYFDFVNYIYNYTDHLGNVRLSYSDADQDGVIQPRDMNVRECTDMGGGNVACIDIWKPGEIVEINNYYPFGMLHNYTATTTNAYQYKYNGKELQETGMYDYGARFYMPDLGRWLSIDPLTEKMRRFSPYNYAWDNPIMFVDPDGMFATPPDDYLDVNGRYLGSDGATTKNVRMINRTDWNTVTSEKGGSLSAEATTALQTSSSIVTVNTSKISADISNANNETIADQTKERQVFVGLEVTRGDVPTAQVTSIRGADGIDGKANMSIDSRSDNSGNVIKQTFTGTNLIALTQAHTHNLAQEANKTNIPGTSTTDAATSRDYGIPIHAIDSYTGAQANGNAVHRVMPNGVATKNIGTTNNQNIGQDSLKMHVDKQKNP